MIVSMSETIKHQEPERNPFFTFFQKKLAVFQIFATIARERLQGKDYF